MPTKIEYIEVFGERNSGTNYLFKLFQNNITNIDFTKKGRLGWKHGDIDLKTKQNDQKEKKTLVVVIHRNPITWLQAMYRAPHHAPHLLGLSFRDFLSTKWTCYRFPDFLDDQEELKKYFRPENEFDCYSSIAALRSAKLEIFENFKNKLENVCYINYEALCCDPIKAVKLISKAYSLTTKQKLANYTKYKNANYEYKKRRYNPLSYEEIECIVKNIDWENEFMVGYQLKSQSRYHLFLQSYMSRLTKDCTPLLRYNFRLRCYHKHEKIADVKLD